MNSLPRSLHRTAPGRRQWPALVAEDLRRVPDPLRAWLRPPAPASAPAVASCIAHAMLPPAAPDPPPAWLRPDQVLSFARALAVARRHGGALLADSVGSGKTWIGLAVASALEPGRRAWVIAPATLRRQWEDVARRAGVAIGFHSQETLSRGRAPPDTPGPVIVDESHRFRNPQTRRYDTLCRWCIGRRGLLLSATPVVNRLEDVGHQLLLLVRHDSLSDGYRGLVVTGEDRSAGLPDRLVRECRPEEPAESHATDLLAGIGRLQLSRDAGIAALIRVALLEAMASSPAALAAALGRYCALLAHGGDAAASGVRVSRQRIRQLVGADLDQLVLWPLVAEAGAGADLSLGDLPDVARLLALARAWASAGGAKLAALRVLTADGRPTLVFTTSLATVRHLRQGIGRPGVAWCTGQGAGLDHQPVEREAVLEWFRRPAPGAPALLVTTDVAAEGLDLPRVERVVHYDLPWTAVRLEQRAGRALRLSSGSRTIEVIRFRPPAALERQLDKLAAIRVKQSLIGRLGLGNEAQARWRRSASMAAHWQGEPPKEGLAVVVGREPSLAACFRIRSADGAVHRLVLASIGGRWTEDAALLDAMLQQAALAPAAPVSAAGVRQALAALLPGLRRVLRAMAGVAEGVSGAPPADRALVRRFRALAREARRSRRIELLAAIDRGIRFVRAGRTAGERRLIADWRTLPNRRLLEALALLPDEAPPRAESVELAALLLVEPAPAHR